MRGYYSCLATDTRFLRVISLLKIINEEKITNKAPAISYPLSRIACDEHYYSPAKAIKELHLPQTPIEVGIKECFDWLKGNGYLNK